MSGFFGHERRTLMRFHIHSSSSKIHRLLLPLMVFVKKSSISSSVPINNIDESTAILKKYIKV